MPRKRNEFNLTPGQVKQIKENPCKNTEYWSKHFLVRIEDINAFLASGKSSQQPLEYAEHGLVKKLNSPAVLSLGGVATIIIAVGAYYLTSQPNKREEPYAITAKEIPAKEPIHPSLLEKISFNPNQPENFRQRLIQRRIISPNDPYTFYGNCPYIVIGIPESHEKQKPVIELIERINNSIDDLVIMAEMVDGHIDQTKRKRLETARLVRDRNLKEAEDFCSQILGIISRKASPEQIENLKLYLNDLKFFYKTINNCRYSLEDPTAPGTTYILQFWDQIPCYGLEDSLDSQRARAFRAGQAAFYIQYRYGPWLDNERKRYPGLEVFYSKLIELSKKGRHFAESFGIKLNNESDVRERSREIIHKERTGKWPNSIQNARKLYARPVFIVPFGLEHESLFEECLNDKRASYIIIHSYR